MVQELSAEGFSKRMEAEYGGHGPNGAESPPLNPLRESASQSLDKGPLKTDSKTKVKAVPGWMREGVQSHQKFEARFLVLAALRYLEKNGQGVWFMSEDGDIVPIKEGAARLVSASSLVGATGLSDGAVRGVLARALRTKAVLKSVDRLDRLDNSCFGFRLTTKGLIWLEVFEERRLAHGSN